MTALANNDITTTLVGTTIGSSSRNIGILCTHANINKWSKYKPVKGTWPQSSNGKYGLNINGLFAYEPPTGGSSNPYRIGHFRGYEHDKANTEPSAFVDEDDTNLVNNLVANPLGGASVSYLGAVLSLNGGGVSEITLAMLGLSSYYFGARIVATEGTFFKTLSDVAADGQSLPISVFMTSIGTYNDFPQDIEGIDSFIIEFILSSQIKAAWTETAPTTWYRLPHETVGSLVVKSQFTGITISGWLLAQDQIMSEFLWEAGDAANVPQLNPIETNIDAERMVGGWQVGTYPSWISLVVRNDTDTADATTPYYQDLQLKVDVDENNSGEDRSGTIELLASDGVTVLDEVTVRQQGHSPYVLLQTDGFRIEFPGDDIYFNETDDPFETITIIFTPETLSATSVTVYIRVVESVTSDVVCSDDTNQAVNGVESEITLTLSRDAVRGRLYTVTVYKTDPD